MRTSVSRTVTAMAAAATLVLGAIGTTVAQDASTPVEVTVGYATSPAWEAWYAEVLKDAETALPDVTIKLVTYPTYDDQLNQLPTQFAAGTVPDIIQWDNAAPVAQYASEGVLVPLEDLVPATSIDLAVYPEALVHGWTIDGHLYAIPAYLQNSAFVYRQDLLERAGITTLPATLEEVATAAAAVKAQTGITGLVLLDNLFHITQYVLAFGGGWDYGRTIDSPANVAGLQYLVDLFGAGDAATAQQLGATWDGDAISKDLAAMSDGGPWYIGFMSSVAPDAAYTLAPVPGGSGNAPFVVTYGGGFTITEGADDPATALRVVEFLTNARAQEAVISTNLGFVPARTDLLDEYTAATPAYAVFTPELLASGRGLDYPPKTTEFGNALVSGFQQLVLDPGALTAQQLLSDLQAQYGQ